MSTNKQANRLIHEKSPYLLQHAHNPVNWFPWSDEAFQKAKSEDKPIFLSIGYSTCHWCHVMERESFEDIEIAELLNDHFVSVKVDREERPDIDHIYMSVCQAMIGHGGWPLTIIMTPEKKPFFAGTYFPKHDRYGLAGLISILKGVRAAWANKREELLHAGEQITNAIRQESTGMKSPLKDEVIHSAYRQFKRAFDEEYGGFGNAPKFPSAHNLLFLLRYWSATGERTALDMVEKTLDMMRRGGIYDHIGFGFCRYSTDRKWLVPHFEKMLYDNAMLAMAYLEAFKATGNKHYGNTAREIFTYVQRNMTSPEGAFYSAEDADSEGKEGLFYIWKPDEIKSILGDKDGERFCVAFDITQYGNFEGFSIPNTLQGGDEDREFIERCRMKLYNAREKRVHPFKDDKVLTSWNGLVAAALAMGGRILSDVSLTDMAGKAIQFLDTRLRRTDGRLLARYRDKDASIPAYLDDYASVQWACLEMYETTYSPAYLEKALALNEDIENLFFDAENGGCFLYGSDAENLIMRPKDVYDGAMPSGNSMVAINLLRLYRLTGEPKFIDLFERQITAFGGQISAAPLGYTHMLSAFLAYLQTSQEVILVSDEPEESLTPYIEILRDGYRPFTTSIVYGKAYPALKSIVPHISGYTVTDGKTQAYVCRNFTCSRPVTDIKGFRQALS